MDKGKRSSIFRYYFMMYFVVLLIPVVICCSYYVYMLFVINSDDIASRKNDLIHAASRFDTVVSEVNYLGDSLASNVEVNHFKSGKNVMEYPNTYKIYELQDSLPDLYLVNQAVYDYYIFFNSSETVINKSIAYTYDQFYRLYLSRASTDSYEKWEDELKRDSAHYGFLPIEKYNVHTDNKDTRLLLYTRPLPSSKPGEEGCVYIYLKEDVIESTMPALEKNTVQLIQDFSGRLIYSKSYENANVPESEIDRLLAENTDGNDTVQKGIRFNGRDYTFISCLSEESGIRYSYLVPNEIINGRLVYCVLMLLAFIMLSIAVGAVLSYHMSLKTVTPINDILNQMSLKIERFEGHQSVLSSLRNTFSYLVDSNKDLSEALNMQKPYLKAAFIIRLLFSGFPNSEDISRVAKYLDCPMEDRVFCILLFRFHAFSASNTDDIQPLLNSFSASITELMEKKLPGSLYTDLGEGQVAFIMNLDAASADKMPEKAEELVSYIKSQMAPSIAQKIFVYGGSVVESADRLHESYRAAAYLTYNEDEQIENNIIWYSESTNRSMGYPSGDMAVKLMHFVTSGDEQGLHDYLEGIARDFFIEKDFPLYLQHMLLSELQATLFRLIGYVKTDEKEYMECYAQLEKNHDMPLISQITITFNLYREICHSMNRQKEMKDSDMISNAIVSYIDTHYSDQNLSLAAVADRFEISQSYLSSLFKQTQGIKFSTYIENIRIDKAKDFLKTTELSIAKISEMVGYGSSNSFCRAFKRVTGLNTSEYRKC